MFAQLSRCSEVDTSDRDAKFLGESYPGRAGINIRIRVVWGQG